MSLLDIAIFDLTFISLPLYHINKTKKMIGSRVNTTDIVYGHITSKMLQKEAKEIDRLFGGEETEE